MRKKRLPIAAIVNANHTGIDGLLADFAFGLRKEGWQVRGIVQQCSSRNREDTVLVDLDDGLSFQLFQKLGAGSISCSVDLGNIAAASGALRRALHHGADLAIANRFGALEATGGGFASEMLALMSARRPLLTVVSPSYLDDWQRFTGGGGVQLRARLPVLEKWFADVNNTKDHSDKFAYCRVRPLAAKVGNVFYP